MQIDYTQKKVSRKIKPCPKCGRNGEYSLLKGTSKKGDYIMETYIHKASLEFGGVMRLVDEHCTIVTPSNTVCTPTNGGLAQSESESTLPQGV